MQYNMQITYYNIMLLSKCRQSGQRTMETSFGSRIAANKSLRSRPRNNIYIWTDYTTCKIWGMTTTNIYTYSWKVIDRFALKKKCLLYALKVEKDYFLMIAFPPSLIGCVYHLWQSIIIIIRNMQIYVIVRFITTYYIIQTLAMHALLELYNKPYKQWKSVIIL
jgi:hypothetical protein